MPQGRQSAPPQSTSVSVPFLVSSSQVAARQVPAGLHTPLAQSTSATHSTHSPTALHLPVAHAVPTSTGSLLGVLPEQMSSVHSLPSSKGSVSSIAVIAAPKPSQTTFLQSPLVWFSAGVLSGTGSTSHTPAAQTAAKHSSGAGQS